MRAMSRSLKFVAAVVVFFGAARGMQAQCSWVTPLTTMDFGAYSVFGGVANATTTGQVKCIGNLDVTIAASTGAGGVFNPRKMSGTALYNVYIDAGRSLIWGDGTGGSNKDPFTNVGTQILESQLNGFKSFEEKLFALSPEYSTLMNYLKSTHKKSYLAQTVITSLMGITRPAFTVFLRQLLGTIVRPTKQNFRVLIDFGKLPLYYLWSLRNLILFYPFRKAYWFTEYVFKKKLIRKLNASAERGHSS